MNWVGPNRASSGRQCVRQPRPIPRPNAVAHFLGNVRGLILICIHCSNHQIRAPLRNGSGMSGAGNTNHQPHVALEEEGGENGFAIVHHTG